MIRIKWSRGLVPGLIGLMGLMVADAGLSYWGIRRLDGDEPRGARTLPSMDHHQATPDQRRPAEAIHRAYLLVDAVIALTAVGLSAWLLVRHLRDQQRAAAS